MAALWLTEAIPIPVTALMPVFMFPMLQVAEAKDISGVYISVRKLHTMYIYMLFFSSQQKCLLDGRQILTVEKQELSTFFKFYSTLFCSFKLFLIEN